MVLFVWLFLFSSDKADFANTVTVGNGFGQVQLTAEAFCNTAVTAHGMVAHQADFFIAAALLLPCLYQRAVMEVDVRLSSVHF